MSKALMSARARPRQDRESLEGITLLRYAHILSRPYLRRTEQYLRQLNRGLLTRHGMTILQMHLVNGGETSFAPEIGVPGRGRLILVPVKVYVEKRSVGSLLNRLKRVPFKSALSNSCGHLRYQTMVLSDGLGGLLEAYGVDLILVHWLSYDVGTLVSRAVSKGIPFAIINHFDNSHFNMTKAHRWTAALGGISMRERQAR